MKLDPKAMAMASAIVTAIIWTICSLLVAAFPGQMMAFTGHMVHADFSQLNWTMDFPGYVIGLVIWTVDVAFAVWLFAVIYNRLTK